MKALAKVKSVPMVSMMSFPRVMFASARQACTNSSFLLWALYSSRSGSSMYGCAVPSGVPQSKLNLGGGP